MSEVYSMRVRLFVLTVFTIPVLSACPESESEGPKPGSLQEGQLCESDLPPEKETCAEGLFCNGQGVSGIYGFCVPYCEDDGDCSPVDGSARECTPIGGGLDFSYCNILCVPEQPTEGLMCPTSYEVTLECSGWRCVLSPPDGSG